MRPPGPNLQGAGRGMPVPGQPNNHFVSNK